MFIRKKYFHLHVSSDLPSSAREKQKADFSLATSPAVRNVNNEAQSTTEVPKKTRLHADRLEPDKLTQSVSHMRSFAREFEANFASIFKQKILMSKKKTVEKSMD